MSPAGVPASSARSGPKADEVLPLAWPRLLRLLLLRRGGWQGKPGCSSSAVGRCRRRVRLRRASRRPSLLSCCGGEEYHVVAAVVGHELETPEAEHRPRLKRLLKATHLELNEKVFVNTQQSPYLAHQLLAFRTHEDPQPTSEFVAACLCPDGLMQDGTQEVG